MIRLAGASVCRAEPEVMHIDLNSCFATVEQQARPLLRGRPIGVTNRKTPNACVVAASIEAKALGVKVGMSFSQAARLAPGLIMIETDPPKYHHVYKILVGIMRDYSPNVTMKSIDEGIIDFAGTRTVINKRPLEQIGAEIKQRLKDDVGCWMRCNIGIAPNRFLAKLAASLHKPDGLDIIDYRNLRQTLSELELTDLSGIANRNSARLNAYGITTPLEFLNASPDLLKKHVFKSINGWHWHQRLRGWEVDDYETSIKTIGRQYVLEDPNLSEDMLQARLAYLAETTAVKMRSRGLCARGINVYVRYRGGEYWHQRQMFKDSFFSNAEVCRRAAGVFSRRPRHDYPREIGVSCYQLSPSNMNQMSLLDDINRQVWLTEAVDEINRQHGEFTVTYATSLSSKAIVRQKIPFGSTRYFDLLTT